MAKSNDRPSILILTTDADEAAEIVKALHRAQVSVRGMYTQKTHRLAELIEKHRCRVLITCLSEQMPAKTLIEHFELLRRTVPMVVIGGQDSEPLELLGLLRAGMATLVGSRNDETLIDAVRHHVDYARQSTRGASLQRALLSCEESLVACSDRPAEPSAWVLDGRLLIVNQAYRALFGLAPGESVEGRRFVDAVAANQRGVVESALAQGHSDNIPKKIDFVGSEGEQIARSLYIRKGSYQTAPCLQVALTLRAAAEEAAGENGQTLACSRPPPRCSGTAEHHPPRRR